jgi:hypothetical protein
MSSRLTQLNMSAANVAKNPNQDRAHDRFKILAFGGIQTEGTETTEQRMGETAHVPGRYWRNGTAAALQTTASTQNHHPTPNTAPAMPGETTGHAASMLLLSIAAGGGLLQVRRVDG